MKPIASIIGDTRVAPTSAQAVMVRAAGRTAIAAGFRIQTGGLGDLPRLIANGARTHPKYARGDILALIPGFDPTEGHGDIVIPTGLDVLRNGLLANADVVVAIGGGAGTLSEIALAWQLNRPIFAWTGSGWSAKLAGEQLDHRRTETIVGFASADALKRLLVGLRIRTFKRHRLIRVTPSRNRRGPRG
jgi:uncharacterized protein (TIGR00725 family)